MMTNPAVFSCFLIGSDTLLMECGDLLLREGQEVRGVITAEPRVAQWCTQRGIRVLDAEGDYGAIMAEEPFDYLFAITYLSIIPQEVLALPRKMAVNFHDGPLPRYAGLNAPVWALMNGEQEYGITFHQITSGVDEGDILKQSLFQVAPRETALSINTRCLAAAVETFPELVRELAAGTATLRKQDLTLRSYFGKFDRPAAACLIDWKESAERVEAFVRALTFGPYPNPVGTAKLVLPGAPEPLLVEAVEIGSEAAPPEARPGEVLEVSAAGMRVATGAGTIVVTRLRSLSGDAFEGAELETRTASARGTILDGPDSDLGRRLTDLDRVLSRGEELWTRRLLRLDPPEVPFAASQEQAAAWAEAPLVVPAAVGTAFAGREPLAVLAAFATYLARTGRKESFHLAHPTALTGEERSGLDGWIAPAVPLRIDLTPDRSFGELVDALGEERERITRRRGYFRDLPLRHPALAGRPSLATEEILPVGVALGARDGERAPGTLLALAISEDGRSARLGYDSGRITRTQAESIGASLAACLASAAQDPGRPWTLVDLVDTQTRSELVVDFNRTDIAYPTDRCVHHLFEEQATQTPDAVAVVFEQDSLTYRQLDERANALANLLTSLGVGPDSLVGVNVDRSVELMVATLGVLKAGGAYVPLDPDFPEDRIAFMVEDSGARVIITQSDLAGRLPTSAARIVKIDADRAEIDRMGTTRPSTHVTPSNLAYAIYTSGSTGKPKGVLVEHRNVVNFFTGMDAVVAHDPPGIWLAVTSLSFDISVLELFWTLARGFKVVIFKDRDRHAATLGRARSAEAMSKGMEFGLFMWGNDDGPGPSKYRLMLEAAKYFDRHGFDSAWTPERHFHAFGGPFPNPSVTGAALAAVTERLAIRSGSCVSPLHHPIRIAEEWGVVDNLSNGRVGIAFASGWQPNDFVLRPESFGRNKEVMLEQIDIVRRLWRGEKVEFTTPRGDTVAFTSLPRPVQPELPFWITTAGNPDTYRQAGAMGANVLTHLLGQSLEEVAEKVRVYRAARAEAGLDPAGGTVTLMLHTFVGTSDDEVREIVRQPMKDYLRASMRLVLGFAWEFPAFKRPGGAGAKMEDIDLGGLSDEENETILDFAFERYFETSGLFGTPETCGAMVDRCKEIGIDEIACLLDFGVSTELVLESLPYLKQVRDEANAAPIAATSSAEDFSFAAQVRAHGVTHLQCTPSMAQMLVTEPEARASLRTVQHLMVGGEAFPPSLARDLKEASDATITNMYGPTETTIWSTTQRLAAVPTSVSIGRPIANTSVYVLDRHRQVLPIGVPGELYIGGDGVTRGYHRRPELTAERFVPDPFRGNGGRMYWTGDLARFEPDGTLGFLGRIDHQVKIRGYRIELGEIESALNDHSAVQMSAVVIREIRPGDQRLVGYIVPVAAAPSEAELKDALRETLPDYMVPAHVVTLRSMPLTPNGKIDRKALPAFDDHAPSSEVEYVAPANEIEEQIAACWRSTLGLERVGVEDNFFDIGGHSLLVVRLHRELREVLQEVPSLVDLYRFPTIRSLTDHLSQGESSKGLEKSQERAERRREVLAARRRGRRG